LEQGNLEELERSEFRASTAALSNFYASGFV